MAERREKGEIKHLSLFDEEEESIEIHVLIVEQSLSCLQKWREILRKYTFAM
jgi:PHP family Zn ribbon phosphoesterase